MGYKVCSRCGKTWSTKEDFIRDCEAKGEMMGLLLYNCACGTTLGIEKYPGSRDEFIRSLKKPVA